MCCWLNPVSPSPSDGSKHSARGPHHNYDGSRHSASGAHLICFPISHVYFLVGGGLKSLAKLDGGGHGPIFPLDPPLPLPISYAYTHYQKTPYASICILVNALNPPNMHTKSMAPWRKTLLMMSSNRVVVKVFRESMIQWINFHILFYSDVSDVPLVVVHMRTYQFDFISRYSRLSSILEIDLHLAQQAFRQVCIYSSCSHEQ